MASVDWMKATTQKAGAMQRHLERMKRLLGLHSNEHIDKSLSELNSEIGCDGYTDALSKMKARTAEVDRLFPPKRVRSDRVTCCFLEIPCPAAIATQGKSQEFFEEVHKIYEIFFGKENVHGSFVHRDELHTYADKSLSRRQSLEHMHTLVSAYAEWSEKGKDGSRVSRKGINGKHFETKGRLKALNELVSEMCMEKFGIPFNTGEKPEKKSVERLKTETELRETAAELTERANTLQDSIAHSQRVLEGLQQERADVESTLDYYHDVKQREAREISVLQARKQELEDTVSEQTQQAEEIVADVMEIKNKAHSVKELLKLINLQEKMNKLILYAYEALAIARDFSQERQESKRQNKRMGLS